MIRARRRPDVVPEPSDPGWPVLSRKIREADVTKVDDCREDIDTLLVFAGLYSAVLTAFVIESYTHLQEDPHDVIIGLLQQIATQNFTSGPGFINSTTPPPSSLSFEPQLWAIRVNILWFTSLILSLTSASFGILVKQWLREYLAIKYSAPRERLRARQYRNPALAKWKIFEIAAFLPLLLQLSLGLFFLGLCFFTSSVHRSISRTAIPLVCAWAFLFFVTIIAPLFSPRCPFKTTFLKEALQIGRLGRRLLIHRLSWGWDFFAIPFHWIADPGDRPALCLFSSAIIFSPVLFPFWIVFCVLRVLLESPPDSGAQGGEEEQFVIQEAYDVDILLSVDSSMSDDGLIPTLLDALQQQAEMGSEKIVQFISQIVAHRVGGSPSRRSFFPDLRLLSKYAWSTITDAIVDCLRDVPGPMVSNSPNWVWRSVIILLAPSQFELSDAAVSELRKLVPFSRRAPGHLCMAGIAVGQRFIEGGAASHRYGLARRLLRLRKSDTVICPRCIMEACMFLLCRNSACSHSSLRHLLYTHASEDTFVAFSRVLILDLLDVLVPYLQWATFSQKDLTGVPGSQEALHIVLQYCVKFGRRRSTIDLCRQMLLTDSGTRIILFHFAALHAQCRISTYSVEIDDDQIRSHLTLAFEQFCNSGDSDAPLDYIRICYQFLWIMDNATKQALAKAIVKYHDIQGWWGELRRRDYWYSNMMSPHPHQILAKNQDQACGLLKHSRDIPVELIDALWLFVPEQLRDEVLHSIREWHSGYTPRLQSAVRTGPENLRGGGRENSAQVHVGRRGA